MPAYMIIEIEVLDPETYAGYMGAGPRYRRSVRRPIPHQKQRCDAARRRLAPDRLIVLEFPSMEAMAAWNRSPEYAALAPLRTGSTRTRPWP